MVKEKIRQFGSEDFRRTVSQLSFVNARKFNGEWRWGIDLEKIDQAEIQNKLATFPEDDVQHWKNLLKKLLRESTPAEPPQRVQEEPAAYKAAAPAEVPANSFDAFIQKIADQQHDNPTVYTVIGDIINGYTCKDGSFLFTMLDHHNDRQTIDLFLPVKLLGKENTLDLWNNMRVKVSGKACFNSFHANIKLNAYSIERLDVCSRQKEQEEYKKVCKPYRRSLQEQWNFTIDNITDVGLITGGSETSPIQGASDFIKRLNKNLKDPQHLHIEYVKMSDIEEIMSALDRLNAAKTCQVIAIVRGGGSPEALACYSNPQLVKAIYESPIPVITGIGHNTDDLLCKQAARYNGQTPTGAADFINRQYCLQYSRQRDRYQAKTEYRRIAANATKDDLLAENDALITELQFVRQENQLLQQKIDELKHRSLISRIFNLG
ncbi:exodeoxyribonuclease VII large subunit [Mitsuokella sp.]|uniref:exodeoxyribonuclease VII large subunit n=1 Tax=Mitsuokella sp. TaxID=2049034 RepID=UPI003D7C58B2